MKTKNQLTSTLEHTGSRGRWPLWLAASACVVASHLWAATAIIYTNNFESYTSVATSLADTADADPTGSEWNIVDDTALDLTTPGAGVQVINWLTNHDGTVENKSLLLRPNTEAQVYFRNAKSGSRYQFDFWINSARGPTSDRNFLLVLRGEGADYNGDDYLAYRSDRAANSTALYYYDGVADVTNATPGVWKAVGTNHAVNVWQHHRIVIDPNALTFSLYLDDMATPILAGADLSRCEVAVPTILRIVNEGNSADDGYFAIDDISLTVTDPVNLLTPFTEGFENYPARATTTDDADPLGPWITTEVDGTGTGRLRAPTKVQVVASTEMTPHSGSKCLKLEGGQRAGASVAWGQPPFTDVQITWWAKVPAVTSGPGVDGVYLRMSLYGAENGSTFAGDCALLGYGSRLQSGTNCGGTTSLIYYPNSTLLWQDTHATYTPDVWEEYQLTTANNLGTYDIVKNPSSANPIVLVNHASFIGTAPFGPTFMAAWSTSNGTNHPPVYVDDITITSGAFASGLPVVPPYTVQFSTTRFTNTTVLRTGGPIGAVTVDPRDTNTIVFVADAASGGGIYQARKVAAGNWSADSTPIVTGLNYPSGVAIEPANGTLWWTHDYAQSVMRLRSPWTSNVPEQIVADFVCQTNDPAAGAWLDDDPCDCVFPPANFNGTISQTWPGSSTWPTTTSPSQLVVLDRGTDFNGDNALYLVDPSTTSLAQTNYDWYLLQPSSSSLGSITMVGMTTLPASGEIVTLNQDGQVTAVNANGVVTRAFWPVFYQDPYVQILPACIASDPTTGRLWIGDQLWRQVFSCAPDGTDCRVELNFPLVNTNRADQQLQFHVPGGSMAFAPDGSFLALSDNSTINGGGRVLIMHNEQFANQNFAITGGSQSGQQVQLNWSSAGAVSYTVQRSLDVASGGSFQDIVTNLSVRQFTDTNAPSDRAFYRVLATPMLTP
jgi:hypothetical protein